MDAGLLPVKELSAANQRLAPEFSDAERMEISRALLQDALDLCEKTTFLRWFVVTGDREVATEARRRGFEVIEDAGGGLNAALGAAIAAVETEGAISATILPVDVPLAQPDDVLDLLDTGGTSDIAIVPSHADGGTNALYLSPPGAVQPRFGPGSVRAHIDQAESSGLRCSILGSTRLGLDLDTADDARAIVEQEGGDRTVELLRRLLRKG